MKILAAGDIHGDKDKIKELVKKAKKEKVDLVILTGDLTFFEEDVSGIIGPFVKEGLKVIFVPGNHETLATADFLAELYGAKNIHGYSMIYRNIGIVGVGGSNIGPNFVLTEKEFYDLLTKSFEKIDHLRKASKLEKVILVSHTHPADTIMEKMSRFIPGSTAIRKAIEKFHPDIVLCSHVHEAEGLEDKIGNTLVISVGKNGRIIEIGEHYRIYDIGVEKNDEKKGSEQKKK